MSIENLKKLLATGERLLKEPHADTLGFDSVDCGTYACFIGWYVRDHGHPELVRPTSSANLLYINSGAVEKHFDLDEHDADQLFLAVCDLNDYRDEQSGERPLDERADTPGPEAYVELERRVGILRELISCREGTRE